MTWMIKGFLGFEIFDFLIFWGGKIWQVVFGGLVLSRDYFGFYKKSKICGSTLAT